MTAMATVHEKVHQRADQEREVDQGSENVRPVLGPEQSAGDS